MVHATDYLINKIIIHHYKKHGTRSKVRNVPKKKQREEHRRSFKTTEMLDLIWSESNV